jgi:hypothetical protein
VGLAHYGTALVQWYVVHSHERHLAGSMIDDEFGVCFYTLNHACKTPHVEGAGADFPSSPISRGRKEIDEQQLDRVRLRLGTPNDTPIYM